MWTILLDIDGTLLLSRGAGFHAIQLAAGEMFGHRQEIPKVKVHGRTDVGILGDLFDGTGFDWKSNLPSFFECYCKHLKTSLAKFDGFVIPGALNFLEQLQRQDDVAIGLLTGNCQGAAIAKIEHFGLSSFVSPFGGFGDHHTDRNLVARDAMDSAARFLGSRFDEQKVWVVGDTPNDIRCGRSVGAKVLAVSTGGSSESELEEKQPDLCVSNLATAGLLDQMLQ